MAREDCFPDWLQRLNRDRYGPNFGYPSPYPVYTVQPYVNSEENFTGPSIQLADAFYQFAGSSIPVANLATRVVHVMPRNPYDTITITAWVSPLQTGVNSPGVPIFFSFNRPGRITTETEIQGSVEAYLAVANAFDPVNDISSFPNCIIMPQEVSVANNSVVGMAYTVATFPTVKTNKPFYFWFNDGIATLPAAGAGNNVGFKAAWFVQGR